MLFISKGFHQSFNYAVEIKIIKIDKGASNNMHKHQKQIEKKEGVS